MFFFPCTRSLGERDRERERGRERERESESETKAMGQKKKKQQVEQEYLYRSILYPPRVEDLSRADETGKNTFPDASQHNICSIQSKSERIMTFLNGQSFQK